ncbi:ABC transporter ATP-binding protein [Bradyrhizobium stylosanthis]|uniref:Amino acid/amide ABC transporter ATP-binding protein 2 (HAAT family) n=1 Tax=Bradyrhizobium stylosanthis TaxID=1803665 RepID=A0A560E2Q3_9BRAD|nr:ABC transporter ATP-binding protein [Bradyrhizobium stylosanthis]TWB03662.1 amino acid/amide ABC transporter ATP-binding protein 2 (HAAT family) [Bradyrhizobium stylosanthis]
MSELILKAESLSACYGRVEALSDVSLQVARGEIVTVVGANGAGKSTLLQSILGAVSPKAGKLTFAGQDITRWPIYRRIEEGLVLVPEGRRILVSMTIEENLLLGAHMRRDKIAVRREIGGIYDRFPNLAQRRNHNASCLSGGEQQMLALGRALLAKPQLLMMDEPSLGLSPLFVQRLFELIQAYNREGLSILLIEQNTANALRIAHRATVLELGRVALEGDAASVAGSTGLQEAYLGGTSREVMEVDHKRKSVGRRS